MEVLHQFITEPHPCPYLADRTAQLEYTVISELTGAEYEDLMNRGYRKFGPMVFRPICEGCTACRSLRIPVDRFRPNRSQRRAWKRNSDLRVQLAVPSVDSARLDLYHRYHAAQTVRRDWPAQERDVQEYALSFVHNPSPAVEITLWEANVLRAVVITDITPHTVSGVYHYHDPDCLQRSLGTYCMLQTIDLARRLNKPWAYFGYYVAGCRSLEYKANFEPCELLDADASWHEYVRPSVHHAGEHED